MSNKRYTKTLFQLYIKRYFNCNALSFDRRELMLLFMSLVEDVLFGVTLWEVGKYKHSTKESVNDDGIRLDEGESI